MKNVFRNLLVSIMAHSMPLATLEEAVAWNKATASSIDCQLSNDMNSNEIYILKYNLNRFTRRHKHNQFDNEAKFRLAFLKFIRKNIYSLNNQEFIIVENFSSGEINFIQNSLIIIDKNKADVFLFDYSNDWHIRSKKSYLISNAINLHNSEIYGNFTHETIISKFDKSNTILYSKYYFASDASTPYVNNFVNKHSKKCN